VTEGPVGVLTKLPFLWLALAAPLAWRGRPSGSGSELRWFVLAIILLFVACAVPVLLLPAACLRYEVDFVPSLALLAVIGLLGIERVLVRHPVCRWLARLGWGGLLACSVLGSFVASCEFWDLLRTQSPQQYRKMVRTLDYPAYWLEQARGLQPGALEIKLHLPLFTAPGNEPLVVTGIGARADYLFMHYVDSGHIILGLEHTGGGGLHSEVIAVDSRDLTLVIEMGSLYPPPDHPYFKDPADNETLGRTKRIAVRVDGRMVLEGVSPFFDASPQTRYIGTNPISPDLGRRFTGKIFEVRILPPPDLPKLSGPGLVNMSVRFSPELPVRPAEPLVVTGETGRADMIYVRRVSDGRIAFGFDHWGSGGPESEPQAIDFGRPHTLSLRMGSFYPPEEGPATNDPVRRRLQVVLDGREILARQLEFHPASASHVYFGLNPVGASTASEYFRGSLTIAHEK
jgi:hypothetical protein